MVAFHILNLKYIVVPRMCWNEFINRDPKYVILVWNGHSERYLMGRLGTQSEMDFRIAHFRNYGYFAKKYLQ